MFIVSTYNNMKGVCAEENGQIIVYNNQDKLYLEKGDYIIFDIFFKFKTIISKEFFKNNFKICGRAEISLNKEDGTKIKRIVGLLCLTDKKEEELNDNRRVTKQIN